MRKSLLHLRCSAAEGELLPIQIRRRFRKNKGPQNFSDHIKFVILKILFASLHMMANKVFILILFYDFISVRLQLYKQFMIGEIENCN